MQNKLLKNKPVNISQQAIGIMDSGVGGLSVLKHIHRLLPYEHLFYVADSQYAPYGSLSPEQITQRCMTVADFLIKQGVKALVVACNTATAASIQLMREQYQLPIVGMEPAVKPAAQASQNGIVGVLATVGTLKSAQFAALLTNYGQDIQVHTQACTGLVECIERGELSTDSTRALLEQYTQPLLEQGADTLVLGCTHYPFVKPLIQDIVGKDIQIIDTGDAVAKHLQNTLTEKALLNVDTNQPSITVWTNSQETNPKVVIQQLWGRHDIAIKRLP